LTLVKNRCKNCGAFMKFEKRDGKIYMFCANCEIYKYQKKDQV